MNMHINWAPSREFVSSSIPSWQILTAHAQPFRGARDLAFCLKVPFDSLLVWASSGGSGETARMRRLAWTFAARIGDKYQIRLTRPNYFFSHLGPNNNLYWGQANTKHILRHKCWLPHTIFAWHNTILPRHTQKNFATCSVNNKTWHLKLFWISSLFVTWFTKNMQGSMSHVMTRSSCNMSHVTRKPVFGVCDQLRLKWPAQLMRLARFLKFRL